MGAVDFDRPVRGSGRECATGLVTVSAQIALTTVKGGSGGKLGHRGGGPQGEISLGIGCVDHMTGAAILPGGVGVTIGDLVG